MDTKLLKEIIEMVEKAKITGLEVCEGDLRIRIEKGLRQSETQIFTSPRQIPNQEDITLDYCEGSLAGKNAGTEKTVSKKKDKHKPGKEKKLCEITSPMLGVFYTAPSPESKPFVEIGDKVKKGDILCIIEAMKLMNEIAAEREGTIEEICMENGETVEFGQTMFRMKE